MTLSLEIFQRLHDGLADFSHIILPEDPYILPQSVRFGDGNVKGIELMYHRRTSKINGWFSYNYTKSENVFPDLNDGKNFLADHDRTHELKSVATTSVGNWNLSLSWFASTGRLYTPTGRLEIFENDYGKSLVATGTSKNTERLEYLDRLDFALSYNLSFSSSNLEIGLSIINCLNRKNISHRRYTFFKDSEDKYHIIPTNVTTLGITPTLYIQFNN